MIKKVLVANRGEIAVRVIRACRAMGIATVAVASDADVHAMHVHLADEWVLIGGPEPGESYLRADRILEAAAETGADAIHPGYGFLSERADFAEACEAAGVRFIGPPASAMRQLGAKIDAKQLAVANQVPVTPGFFEPKASDAQLKVAAAQIGYPVMLKASAGGGGRGMRVVHDPANFDQELAIARDEAVKGFGDGAMMVEKLVERPRHIEVQLLADAHGQAACLFERDCSIQRRHQKLVEESPSPIMTDDLWKRMREASLRLAKAAGYVGAGTVEFMVDESSGEFYFLEVNARLQVEHPVTEAVTGVDLVEWQIRIASGEPLALDDDLMAGDRRAIRGHAIEVRIVAEDASKNFMPSIGPIVGWAAPSGPGVRFDTGYSKGSEVTRFYDSLIAKLIVHGETRDQAIRRLRHALLDTHILGVKTNVAFLLDVADSEDFEAGRFDTGWMGRQFPVWKPSVDIPTELAAILAMPVAGVPIGVGGSSERRVLSPAWAIADGFRNARS